MGHGGGSKKSGDGELYKDKQGMYRGKWAEDHGPGKFVDIDRVKKYMLRGKSFVLKIV
jgi:hypothetical protein